MRLALAALLLGAVPVFAAPLSPVKVTDRVFYVQGQPGPASAPKAWLACAPAAT